MIDKSELQIVFWLLNKNREAFEVL